MRGWSGNSFETVLGACAGVAALLLSATLVGPSTVVAEGEAKTGVAERAPAHRVGGDGHGYLAKRLRARHGQVGEGKRPVTGVIAGTLRTGERKRIPLTVEGGKCYVVLAVGVPSVRELDLRLVDAFGKERDKDRTRDAFPAVRACPAVGGTWHLDVHMFHGYGRYAVQAFAGR